LFYAQSIRMYIIKDNRCFIVMEDVPIDFYY